MQNISSINNPTIIPYKGKIPKISKKAFVATGAVIIGDVEIDDYSSIWPNCVIRGDVNYIRIGKRTNIQDGTVIHVTRNNIAGDGKGQTIIGDDITIGHNAMLHGCILEDETFVGMSATVMDNAVLRSRSMLAAGAVLTPNKEIMEGQIWAGNPAKFFREMKEHEVKFIKKSADNYVGDMMSYFD